MFLIFILFLIISSLALLGVWELRYTYKITTLNVLTKNPNLIGKKFAGFSDPQFSVFTQSRLARRITKILKDISPDKILIAGDIFDGEKLYWPPIISEMKKWSEVAPVYAVTGNHEHYGNYDYFLKLIKEANFNLIQNQVVEVDGVKILGTDFAFNSVEETELNDTLFQGLKSEKIDIILRHVPPSLDLAKKIAEYHPALMFCGHTHNGQSWPMNYVLRAQYGSFSYGETKIKNTIFYTTSGFGITLIPVRLFNPPEIVVINFVS